MKNNVAVLLSSYNGEKYIKEQIKSILNQKKVNVTFFIRDDGSTDSTVKIIDSYLDRGIQFVKGENIGYAKSFWQLIKMAEHYDYYAFCDQDDIWDENKLYEALKLLNEYDHVPALYTSRVVSVDNNMNVLNENTFPVSRVLNVYESFQRSVVPGCVFVFNNTARNVLVKYNGRFESHDWATYAIINTFGKVIYDKNSYIKYRIHENNVIGKKNNIASLIIRIKRFFKKSKCVRSVFAKDFYNTYNNSIPAQYKNDIYILGHYKDSLRVKFSLLTNKKFKGVIFKIYVFLNRV